MSRSSSRIFASMASVWSISKSFQSSFGGGDQSSLNQEYARDVAAVGAAFVGSGEPEDTLRHDVTQIAESHGITDWEAVDETWLGLGVGFRHAGMSQAQAEDLLARAFSDEEANRAVAWVYAQ